MAVAFVRVPFAADNASRARFMRVLRDQFFLRQEIFSAISSLRTLQRKNKKMNTQLKYMLFAGTSYYPRGGAADFKGFGNDVDELKKLYSENINHWDTYEPWGHICNADTMIIVSETNSKGEWV